MHELEQADTEDLRPDAVGYPALVAHAIKLAVVDLSAGNPVHKSKARDFFASAWFDELALVVDLDADAVRQALRRRGLL